MEVNIESSALYYELKMKAWSHFVFRRTPEPEVGYGRLECECPNVGKFLESYTADLDDHEAEGYDAEKEALLYDDNISNKKRKLDKLQNTEKWRNEQDALWIKECVERPHLNYIYQMPYMQIQSVCYGGLTKFRTTVLQAFQKTAKQFGYSDPVYSGSPAGILQDLVFPAYDSPSVISHNMTNQLAPFVWEKYHTPVHEALCVYWCYCPIELFNKIACGHGPGETFEGKTTLENHKIFHADWRKQLATATQLCMKDGYDFEQVKRYENVLRATFPLKLVYISDTGDLRQAKNLELCRTRLMGMGDDHNTAKYPLNPLDDYDYELEPASEDLDAKSNMRLDLDHLPSMPDLDMVCPDWRVLMSSGGGSKFLQWQCKLCVHKTNQKENVEFTNWKDFVLVQFNHAAHQHGPVGANAAMTVGIKDWIDFYMWEDLHKSKLKEFIFPALIKAGFRESGVQEQGFWKKWPSCIGNLG